jgi:hypothetical protein
LVALSYVSIMTPQCEDVKPFTHNLIILLLVSIRQTLTVGTSVHPVPTLGT